MQHHHLPEASPYNETEFEALKQHVYKFMQEQPGYSAKSLTVVWAPEDGGVYIQYGKNLQSGIAGFGESCESAFNDFLREWNSVHGEKHIKKYNTAYNDVE